MKEQTLNNPIDIRLSDRVIEEVEDIVRIDLKKINSEFQGSKSVFFRSAISYYIICLRELMKKNPQYDGNMTDYLVRIVKQNIAVQEVGDKNNERVRSRSR